MTAPAPIVDIDARYTYDASGNIQAIVNNPSGTQDTQGLDGYDYLRRVDRAWTSASTATDPCAGGPSVTGVGGLAPDYHAYPYPAAGQAQPHTLSQMTESTPAGDRLYSYQYDAAGNTTKRTRTGEDETLVWDAEGNLESVTDAAGKKTSFTYDVDGSRMLCKEPNATPLYLPGMEIRPHQLQ